MKNKVLIMMLIMGLIGFTSSVQAAMITSRTVYLDDFQTYPVSNPADFSATGNWVWNGNGDGGNDTRIFSTGNYGGTKLWIADASSAAAGSGINSLATIPVVAGTNYTFRGAIVCETNVPTRTASFTVDLLVGGVSQIGGPLAGTAKGDDTIPDSYDDQWTIIKFTPTTTGNLEIRIAFTGTDATNPYVGIDEVSVVEPLVLGIDESGDSTDVTEGVGSDTYDLVLLGDPNYPTSPVTVTLTADAQVAVTGASSTGTNVTWDLGSVPQTVTFPDRVTSSDDPNDYTVTLTVEAVNDTDIEGDHTGTITHASSSADAGWDAKTILDVVVNILDDDGTAEIISVAAPLWVGEGYDPNDSYTLVLGKPPVTGTTVTVTPNGGGQLVAVPASFVFTPADWSIPQTVTIEAVDDAVVEGTHYATVTHTVTSSDPEYTFLTVPDLPAVIGDNDAQGPAGIVAMPAVWYNENSSISRDNGTLAADGQEITLWEDQSGNRRYASGKDYYGNDNPRFDATTNSADFVYPSAILSTNNWDTPLAQPTTIFCVGSLRSLPFTGYFYDSLDGTNRHILTAHSSGTWQIGAGAWPNTSKWYLGAPVINVITFNGASSSHRVNGAEVFSGDMGTHAMNGLVLGCRYNTANHLDGQISEFIIYNEALGAADIEAVEEYLINKWTGRLGIIETGGTTEVNEVVDPNTDTYNVLVYGTPTQPVDVTITPTGDNAGDVDLGSGSGTAHTLNLPAAATPTATDVTHTVTVAAVDNATSDGPRQVPLTHLSVSADTDYNAQTTADVIVTVNDNEAWCGQAGTVYYDADLNQDCVVSLPDFAILASQWLDCTNPGDPGCN